MTNKYIDLIKQTFYFPQEGFQVKDNYLFFNDVPLKKIIDKYGTPLKIIVLPKISAQIRNAQTWFRKAFKKHHYKGKYYYCYCTKSSHFSYVLEEVLRNEVHLETSFAYDIDLIRKLYAKKLVNKNITIVCNGYKTHKYARNIAQLINNGFRNVIPVLDNKEELKDYQRFVKGTCKIGIRIAAEEEPTFEFYTSRLGIAWKDILDFYKQNIQNNRKFRLKMLHFFINTGIKDSAYYWSELNKALNVYCQLKKICPDLDSLNIGGGFPIRYSMAFNFDYEYMVNEIVNQIKNACKKARIPVPDIYTEFGNYTVGESGATIFKVLGQKLQNDSELWYMINGSLITNLPDSWGLGQRFILLPVNKWDNEYHRVNIGGISCDIQDYYNSEVHLNQVYLPKSNGKEPLYVGFFHTGAYQDALSGYGGIKHCLVPSPKHVLVYYDKKGRLKDRLFSREQTAAKMLKILGY